MTFFLLYCFIILLKQALKYFHFHFCLKCHCPHPFREEHFSYPQWHLRRLTVELLFCVWNSFDNKSIKWHCTKLNQQHFFIAKLIKHFSRLFTEDHRGTNWRGNFNDPGRSFKTAYLLCHRSQTFEGRSTIDMTLTIYVFPSLRFVIINVELEVIDCV